MKKNSLFIGLLLSALLMAGQALAGGGTAPAPVGNFYLPPSPDTDGYYQIKWRPSPTAGVTYTLEEATNAAFTTGLRTAYTGTATYTYIGTPTKNTAGDYYYRIKATLGGVDSTTLTAATKITVSGAGLTVGKPSRLSFPPTDADGKFRVIIGLSATAGATYELEQCTGVNTGCSNIYTGLLTYKDVVIASSGTVFFRARATKDGMTPSAYVAPLTGTVVTIPGTKNGSESYAATYPDQSGDWTTSRHANSNTAPALNLLATNSCNKCHNPTLETTTKVGCEACHGPGVVDPATTIAVASASCAKCHNNHYSASNTIATEWTASAHNNGSNSCVSCHNAHTLAASNATCIASCHTATVTPHIAQLTNCLECHSPHSLAVSIPETDIAPKLSAHEITGLLTQTTPIVTDNGVDLFFSFNVKRDGVNATDLTFARRLYRFYYDTFTSAWKSTYYSTGITLDTSDSANGNYTLKLTGGYTNYRTTNSRYMIQIQETDLISTTRTSPIVDYPATAKAVLVSDSACINCHSEISAAFHNGKPPVAKKCAVCHDANTTVMRRVAPMVHGIHNASNMPAGYTFSASYIYTEIPYPTYMLNCSVCHDTPETLAVVNSYPPSFTFCMGCHGDWTGFGTAFDGVATDHTAFTAADDCTGCHIGKTVSNYHNGFLTERSGLIHAGTDVSVVEGAKVNMQITDVVRTPDDTDADSTDQLVITWTATYNGTPVDPCNTTVAIGAPIFHAGGAANAITGQAAQNMSMLRAYGQGDDWVNANGISTAPGQAASTNLVVGGTASGATTCIDNVATSNIMMTTAEHTSTASKGIIALQGKPQIKLSYTYDNPLTAEIEAKDVTQIRAKTPTREFVVADGTLPGILRREIVDTAACLKCHVGSLYQHGGNRIDNVEMCILCHNEASSDQNNRNTDGVDATEAYDGKVSQTYGFKTLLHKIHSSAETGVTTEIHRINNGIYVWTGETTVVPNWPGTGTQTVYGSSPTANRNHTLYRPGYPQDLKNCASCHKVDTFGIPDGSKTVATTVNTGASYTNQLDDTLQGPAAAACMTCHQSSDPAAQALLTDHANRYGFTPTVLANGRADILNGTVTEKCSRCHESAPPSGPE